MASAHKAAYGFYNILVSLTCLISLTLLVSLTLLDLLVSLGFLDFLRILVDETRKAFGLTP